MPASTTTDRPGSPEERKQRRRSLRQKRRARIAGPFLGIPLLLGTLMLSVDLIEYDLQPEGERLVDRPTPEGVVEKARKPKAASSPSVPTTSIVSTPQKVAEDGLGRDVTLQAKNDGDLQRDFAPPTQPYALDRAR